MTSIHLKLPFILPFCLCVSILVPPTTKATEIKNTKQILKPLPIFTKKKESQYSILIKKPALLTSNTQYYSKAKEYFKVRNRPLHHFLDIGIGFTPIHSFHPFEFTAYPFSAYLNYRREQWGSLKIPIIFSFQYKYLLSKDISLNKIHTLIGVRYPTSHDLRLFHVDFLTGLSLPTSFNIEKIALEMRLLFTHIIGPKSATTRLYFQWGTAVQLQKTFRASLLIQIGLDNHI